MHPNRFHHPLVRRLGWGVAGALAIATGCRSETPPRTEDSTATTVSAASAASAAFAVDLAKSYGLAIEPEAADGVPIRVVDATSGKPVGDALVVTVDEQAFTYWDSDEKWNARTLLKELGRAHVTAADGRTRVEAPTEPRSLFVWRGDAFGRTTLEVHDRAEHVVGVAPRSLLVTVVDQNGRPQADVPVQLGKCSLAPTSAGTTVGSTGADGRFEIPALELERGVHRSCGRRDLVMLGCLVGGSELRAADAPRLEPVQFVLPECGAIDVELQDTSGRPLRKESGRALAVSLLVEFGKDEGAGEAEDWAWDSPSRTLALPLVDGRCRIDRVELGMRIQLRLEIQLSASTKTYSDLLPLDSVNEEPKDFLGPTRAGETKHVVLRADGYGGPSEDGPTTVAAPTERSNAKEEPDPVDTHSSIEVGLQLDVPIEPCWLRVRLDGNGDPHEHDSNPWIDVNGCATVRNVPAGTHSIAIAESRFDDHDSDVVLLEIDDVEVAPAQHLRDPRLMHVDLRGRLHPRHLDVVDAEGRPLSGIVRMTRKEDADWSAAQWFERGRVDFLTATGDGVQAAIAVRRFRPAVIDSDSAERRVVMKRGIPIRLALAPGFVLPDSGKTSGRLRVGVQETPRTEPDTDEPRTVELRPGADLRFELAEPGEWPVAFRLVRPGANGRDAIEPTYKLDQTITVQDRADEQLFVLTPDRDCWDSVVQSLRVP